MQAQRIKGKVGEHGVLRLELPVGIPDKEMEVVVIFVRPSMSQEEWHSFINATAGSLAEDPIERGA